MNEMDDEIILICAKDKIRYNKHSTDGMLVFSCITILLHMEVLIIVNVSIYII